MSGYPTSHALPACATDAFAPEALDTTADWGNIQYILDRFEFFSGSNAVCRAHNGIKDLLCPNWNQFNVGLRQDLCRALSAALARVGEDWGVFEKLPSLRTLVDTIENHWGARTWTVKLPRQILDDALRAMITQAKDGQRFVGYKRNIESDANVYLGWSVLDAEAQRWIVRRVWEYREKIKEAQERPRKTGKPLDVEALTPEALLDDEPLRTSEALLKDEPLSVQRRDRVRKARLTRTPHPRHERPLPFVVTAGRVGPARVSNRTRRFISSPHHPGPVHASSSQRAPLGETFPPVPLYDQRRDPTQEHLSFFPPTPHPAFSCSMPEHSSALLHHCDPTLFASAEQHLVPGSFGYPGDQQPDEYHLSSSVDAETPRAQAPDYAQLQHGFDPSHQFLGFSYPYGGGPFWDSQPPPQ